MSVNDGMGQQIVCSENGEILLSKKANVSCSRGMDFSCVRLCESNQTQKAKDCINPFVYRSGNSTANGTESRHWATFLGVGRWQRCAKGLSDMIRTICFYYHGGDMAVCVCQNS